MTHCKDCKFFNLVARHTCSCPKMLYGYAFTPDECQPPDVVRIEDDEGWGMIPGPEFGCVHGESTTITLAPE